MGLGSTARKIQTLSDSAEKMYKQVQELQSRIVHLEEEVDDTHDTVKRLDRRMAEQRALLTAMAEAQGLDAEGIIAEAAIDEAEAADGATEPGADDAGENAGDGETTASSAE